MPNSNAITNPEFPKLIRDDAWHNLRATFGTRLGDAGFSLKYIMELMGHSDPKTCLRYVRATDAVKRAAVQAAMLGGHSGSPSGQRWTHGS